MRGGTIKWNRKGFEEIRRSPGVNRLLQAEVDRVMGSVGGYPDDYVGGVESGKSRSRGFVVTTSVPAMRREARDHTLIRALGSA